MLFFTILRVYDIIYIGIYGEHESCLRSIWYAYFVTKFAIDIRNMLTVVSL